MIFRIIHQTFGPHVTLSSFLQATLLLFQPWRWKNGTATEKLRTALGEKFGAKTTLFSSGREVLLAILKTLNLQAGEEVVIQGYTCTVVVNAIHAAGGVPVYADIDRNTLNLTAETVTTVLSRRTRAIICQHTFGIPADTASLRLLCDTHNLLLIEDCAHILPDSVGPKEIGQYGDVLFCSFGRDKAISGITGGAALTIQPSNCTTKLYELEKTAVNLPSLTIFRLLLYPFLYSIARPFYGCGIGKGMLWLAQKTGLLLPYVSPDEKNGHMSPLLHKLPNTCAALALTQLQKLQSLNEHRRYLTHVYVDAAKKNKWDFPKKISPDLPLQKFPLFASKADSIRSSLKKQNVHLEDGWSGAVVCPRSTNQQSANYHLGSCPTAERVAMEIVNLPTHGKMTEKMAKRLVDKLQLRFKIAD